MILIIAEKPSLGRNIAAGIGEMTKRSGYLEGHGYIITWAFGHLFSLADIEDYGEKLDGTQEDGTEKKRWTMHSLPCFPANFRFKLRAGDAGIEKQFALIRTLCARADVDTVVNAGDADREGEIIVRLCLQNAPVHGKKLLRLWLPDQTPKTVAAALAAMKEESAYDNLANEGFARTYSDWLYGVNLTRYATLKSGTLLRVGRVIVPIVKAIYDRDMAIRNFTPEIYYAATGTAEVAGEKIEISCERRFAKNEKEKGEAFCRTLSALTCRVTDKKTKRETLAPGKLFSLSKLQSLLGKKYKMSMADSLRIVQKLYEEGYLTYPRTNSEYLATNEKEKVKEIIALVSRLGYPCAFRDHKRIFDDSKIESHSALTPTYKIQPKGKLTDEETKVYSTVFRRFVAVFCQEPCKVERTEIELRIDGLPNGESETFTLKGTTVLEMGWMKYDDGGMRDKLLPPLKVGDEIPFQFILKEKETAPPRHYTIETLNSYLKNPFREDKAQKSEKGESEGDDAEDYRAIFEGLELGTEATRTGIIDNARKSGYIDLKKDVYTILPGGIYLMEALARMQISMDKYKTSEMGKALKRVYRGEMSVNESVQLAEREIAEVFARERESEGTSMFGDELGACPLCGKKVVCGRYHYGCTGYKEGCTLRIPFTLCGRMLPLSLARRLLAGETSEVLEGFVSKKGTPFAAALKLEDGRVSFVFEERKKETSPYGIAANPAEAPLPEEPPAWLSR